MSKTEAAPTRGDFQGMAGLRRAFATRTVERRLRPVLSMERFGAGS